ncbi:MAG: AbrB/MazE/SpoVT family DNA-binding domain-containing protein [Candidatus Latescibacteria bacterium]|nr:AbrB/MazE/SpoVT family DNA-binding domain-containing protein [Candidatus Latescibacterota bacterium]
MESKITSKYQITIPRSIRDKLKLKVADAIEWKIEDDRIYVEAARKPFLQYKGAVKVGPGDIEEDIAQARAKRARRYT